MNVLSAIHSTPPNFCIYPNPDSRESELTYVHSWEGGPLHGGVSVLSHLQSQQQG